MTDISRIRIRIRADSGEVNRASDAMGRFTGATQRASNAGQRASSALGGVFSIIGGVGVVSMLKLVDAYNTTNGLLRIVTSSTQEYNATQKELFDLAQDNFQSIGSVTKQYAGQAKQLQDMGRTHEEALAVVDLFGKSLQTSGSSATESAAATLQWTQAISGGVLRGEEFNSIMENGRGVAVALADGLNVSIGGLRSLALEGKLSAKVVVDALLSQGDAIRKRFNQLPLSIGNAWQLLTNSITVKLAEIDKQFGVTSGIAKFLKSISDALDDTTSRFNITNAAIAALGAVAVPVLFMITSGLIAATVAATAFALTPVGAIVVGLTAAVGAVLYLKDEVVTFGDNTASVMDWVVSTFQYVGGKVSDLAEKFTDWFSKVDEGGKSFEILGGFISVLQTHAKNKINSIIGLFVGAKRAFVYAWESLPDAMYNIFAGIYNTVVGTVNSMVEGIVSPLNKVLDAVGMSTIKMSAGFSEMKKRSVDESTSMSEAFGSAFETDYVGDFGDSVVDAFVTIRDEIGELASDRRLDRMLDEADASFKKLSDSAKPIPPVLKSISSATKGAKKAADELAKSKSSLAESYAAELISLEKERLQIIGNEEALYRYGLEQERFGKNNLKYSESQIEALLVDKRRNIAMEANKESLKKITDAETTAKKSVDSAAESAEIARLGMKMSDEQLDALTLSYKDGYTKVLADAEAADKAKAKASGELRSAEIAAKKAVDSAAESAEIARLGMKMSDEQLDALTISYKDGYTKVLADAEAASNAEAKANAKKRESIIAVNKSYDEQIKKLNNEAFALNHSTEEVRRRTLANEKFGITQIDNIMGMEAANDATSKAIEINKEFGDIVKDDMLGSIKKLVDTGNPLLDSLINKFIDLAFESEGVSSFFDGMFSGGSASGGGGGIGGFIASLFHTGGVPGVDSGSGQKSITAMPRYHTGGIPGLTSNERPIIVEDDEGVFTSGQMAAMAPVAPIVNAMQKTTNNSEIKQVNVKPEIVVELIEDASKAGQVSSSQMGEKEVIQVVVSNIYARTEITNAMNARLGTSVVGSV